MRASNADDNPAGPSRPVHEGGTSKPAMTSVTVGAFGNRAERFSLTTASAFALPERMCGRACVWKTNAIGS